MANLFSSQIFDSNGKRQKVSEDPRTRAAEAVRMRATGDPQAEEARKKFDSELIRAKVNIFLRNVDRHVKNGEIEEAERELRKAKELEPRNLYIHAFEERIAHIKRVHTQPPPSETAQPVTTRTITAPSKAAAEIAAQISKRHVVPTNQTPADQTTVNTSTNTAATEQVEPEQSREAQPQQELKAAPKPMPAPTPTPVSTQSLPTPPKPRRMDDTPTPRRSHGEHGRTTAQALSVPHSWRKRCLEAYRQCLVDVWMQGGITPQESASINALRERLEIGDDEHQSLERDVQWRVYINAILEGCLLSQSGEDKADKIEQLREEFHIPAEAHFKIMKKTRREILTLVDEYSVVMNESQTMA